MRAGRSSAGLSIAPNHILVGYKFIDPHRAAGVKFIRGNTDFRPHTEFAAIGKPRGGVVVNHGGINAVEEFFHRFGISCKNTIAVVRAVFMVLRILMLITCTFLLTYTTSPIALTDGLESLLNPLKKIRVPVHELAMMMCIALRFVPTLIEETDKIMCAQKARGADFENGNLIRRVKALVPILVPLFISSFRRADELATAMECRCYHGGEGRTKMKLLRYKRRDYLAFLTAVVLLAAVIVLVQFGL